MASGDTDNVSEDKYLANWNRWLRIRREQHKKLGVKVHRSPAALLMNSAEDASYLREEKEILERSQKIIMPDKYRGHPDFWRIPPMLAQKPGFHPCAATLTKKERGLPMEPLERIGCPDRIKLEKDLVPKITRLTSKDKWKRSEYVAERRRELRETAAVTETLDPRIEGLMIQGYAVRRIVPAEVKFISEPVTITVKVEKEVKEDKAMPCRSCCVGGCFCYKQCLEKIRVQGSLIDLKPNVGCEYASARISYLFPKETTFKFKLIFNTVINRKQIRHFRLENLAGQRLDFSWKFNKKTNVLKPVHFFFNKNNNLLLPGHIIHFPITFHSRSPGVFLEEWCLVTSPGLLGNAEIIISLWGKADGNDYQELEEMAAVESYLQHCLAQTAARETVDDSLVRSTFSEPPASREDHISLFTEKDLFELINPGFYYHPSIVVALKAMHIEMCGAESSEWNLNLKTFRRAIVEKSVNIEERRARLEVFNENVKKLLVAPQIQTLDLNMMKFDLGKGIFGHLPSVVEDESLRLKECYKQKETSAEETETSETKKMEDEEAIGTSAIQNVGDDLPIPKLAEVSETVEVEDQVSQPEHSKINEVYEDTLYKTLYQHLSANIDQLAANIESIKMCNIDES